LNEYENAWSFTLQYKVYATPMGVGNRNDEYDDQSRIMKTLARIGAALSFTFLAIPGLIILMNARALTHEDGFILAAIGLFLVGLAFFAGTILWLAGEKWTVKK
jgi:uncharacterized membrane protein YgdD (TMEM256/DUF423 family)